MLERIKPSIICRGTGRDVAAFRVLWVPNWSKSGAFGKMSVTIRQIISRPGKRVGQAVSDALEKFEACGEERAFVQRFSVAYEFPVHFSRDVFAESNPVLAEALRAAPGARQCRAAFFIDDGLGTRDARPAAAYSSLSERCRRRAGHASRGRRGGRAIEERPGARRASSTPAGHLRDGQARLRGGRWRRRSA